MIGHRLPASTFDCQRCGSLTHTPTSVAAEFCDFCRAYADERLKCRHAWTMRDGGGVAVVDAGRAGRSVFRGLRYTQVMLAGNYQAALITSFHCVDYWPEGKQPLLFETRLAAMDTARVFDQHTRRHGTVEAAVAWHRDAVERLKAMGARAG